MTDTPPLPFPNPDEDVTATLGIDVEDWYQVENLRGVCPVERWDEFESRVERNVDTMLELLDEAGRRVTFFVLGAVAARYPDTVVRRIAERNHELASHGYGHTMLSELDDEEFRQDVTRSKALIEDLSGQPVLGYRAPNFSIHDRALDILREVGFRYDSSFNPTGVSTRYGRLDRNAFKPAGKILELYALYEIPMSTFDILGLRLPMSGGGYFRLYPYPVLRSCARRIVRQKGLYNFYIHPWEIDGEIPRVSGLRPDFKFRHYMNLSRGKKRFAQLLRDFEFQPLVSLVPSDAREPR